MYERSWPTYHGVATQHNYTSPSAPVFIVSGAAGNKEGTEPIWEPSSKFRAFHTDGFDTGYARIAVNRTSFVWHYVNSITGAVVDEMVITK
jgi:acid phosphatase type 7